MKPQNLRKLLWGIGAILLFFLGLAVYRMMTTTSVGSGVPFGLMLIIGLLLGGAFVYMLVNRKRTPTTVVESSHTVVESIRKVFKVVLSEGHFNEIYDYEESKKLFSLIPSTKKALVIIQGKVLVGYDFSKFKWEADELQRSLRIVDFPAPEVLSVETDYKYYNIEENFFNMFSRDDLAKIQQNGKKQLIEAAKQSHLPQAAAEQMRTLLTELLQSKNWNLINTSLITDAATLPNRRADNVEKREL